MKKILLVLPALLLILVSCNKNISGTFSEDFKESTWSLSQSGSEILSWVSLSDELESIQEFSLAEAAKKLEQNLNAPGKTWTWVLTDEEQKWIRVWMKNHIWEISTENKLKIWERDYIFGIAATTWEYTDGNTEEKMFYPGLNGQLEIDSGWTFMMRERNNTIELVDISKHLYGEYSFTKEWENMFSHTSTFWDACFYAASKRFYNEKNELIHTLWIGDSCGTSYISVKEKFLWIINFQTGIKNLFQADDVFILYPNDSDTKYLQVWERILWFSDIDTRYFSHISDFRIPFTNGDTKTLSFSDIDSMNEHFKKWVGTQAYYPLLEIRNFNPENKLFFLKVSKNAVGKVIEAKLPSFGKKLSVKSCKNNSSSEYDIPYEIQSYKVTKNSDGEEISTFRYTIDSKYGNDCDIPYIFEWESENWKVYFPLVIPE